MKLSEILSKIASYKFDEEKISLFLKNAGYKNSFIKAILRETSISIDALKKLDENKIKNRFINERIHTLVETYQQLADKSAIQAQITALLEQSTKQMDEEGFEQEIRLFLKQRWALIQGTDAGYVSFPHSPINQICIELAQAIVKPEEPLAQLLMPTLVDREYMLTGDSLIDLTEVREGDKRELAFWNFMISQDGTAVLPFHAWFQSQALNAGEFFNHLYAVDGQLVPLTEIEKNHLRSSAMPHSEDFFEGFETRKKLLSAKGTLAEALARLCDGLIANGKSGRGSESTAHDDVYDYIREFGRILNTLAPGDRESIYNLSSSSGTFLQFWRIISGEDGTNRPKDPINCVEVNGFSLRRILDGHLDTFSKIKIGEGEACENASSSSTQVTPFTSILKMIQSKLLDRKSAFENYRANEAAKEGEKVLKFYYPETMDRLEERLEAYAWDLEYSSREGEGYLIKKLGDLDYFQTRLSPENFDALMRRQGNVTLLEIYHQACKKDTSRAVFLLSKNYFTPPDNTLHEAVSANNIHLVRGYIQSKRDLNSGLNTGMHSALHLAVEFRFVEIAALLVAAGADCSERYEYNCYEDNLSILIYALKNDWDPLIKALLNRDDLDFNARCSTGATALHYAAGGSASWLVSRLLEKGADPNLLTRNGRSPLHYAAEQGKLDSLKVLLAHQAKVQFEDEKNSSLYLAIDNGHTSCAIALIEAGADFLEQYSDDTQAESSYKPILEIAHNKGMEEVVCACLDHESNLRKYIRPELLNTLLNSFLNKKYPRRMEPYIKKLFLAGATHPQLFEKFRAAHLHFSLPEIMSSKTLHSLKILHGFDGLCQLTAVQADSADALKLFSACVEKWLRSKPGQNDNADKIAAALGSGSLRNLCEMINCFQSLSSSYSYDAPSIDPWAELPPALKDLVKAYTIDPQSAVSRKRTYVEFSS